MYTEFIIGVVDYLCVFDKLGGGKPCSKVRSRRERPGFGAVQGSNSNSGDGGVGGDWGRERGVLLLAGQCSCSLNVLATTA